MVSILLFPFVSHLVSPFVSHRLFSIACPRRTGALIDGIDIVSVISATLSILSESPSISSDVDSDADACVWDDDLPHHDDLLLH